MARDTKYKFSYSEKRDIVTCPHRYQLITIQGVQTVDADVVRRLLVPNTLDLALTTWVNNGFPGSLVEVARDRYEAYCKTNIHSIRWKHPMDFRDCDLNLRDAAVKLEAAMRCNDLIRAGARAQVTIMVKVDLPNGEQLKLTGRLDLLYPDMPEIWDLKTTDNAKWLDMDQLVYYDFAVSLMLGKKVKRCGFLVPLIDPSVQYTDEIGREEWEQLFEELNFGMQTITVNQFPDLGKTEVDCFMCFAKRFCRRYAGRGPKQIVTSGKSTKVGF